MVQYPFRSGLSYEELQLRRRAEYYDNLMVKSGRLMIYHLGMRLTHDTYNQGPDREITGLLSHLSDGRMTNTLNR